MPVGRMPVPVGRIPLGHPSEGEAEAVGSTAAAAADRSARLGPAGSQSSHTPHKVERIKEAPYEGIYCSDRAQVETLVNTLSRRIARPLFVTPASSR